MGAPKLCPWAWETLGTPLDVTRRVLEAAYWLWLGCWSNNAANSHLSPGAFNSRVLHSCLVPQCSYRLIDPTINDALRTLTGCLRPTPADNLPILAGIQPAELRHNGATLSLARHAMEPGHLLRLGLTCQSSANARNLKPRQPIISMKIITHD